MKKPSFDIRYFIHVFILLGFVFGWFIHWSIPLISVLLIFVLAYLEDREEKKRAPTSLETSLRIIDEIKAKEASQKTKNTPTGYPSNWDEIRIQVLKRDGHKCCNDPTHTGKLHVHHIVPKAKGGSDRLSNLRTVCGSCHKKIHPHMK